MTTRRCGLLPHLDTCYPSHYSSYHTVDAVGLCVVDKESETVADDDHSQRRVADLPQINILESHVTGELSDR